MAHKEIISARELEELGILKRRTALDMAKRGLLPHVRFGCRRGGVGFFKDQVIESLKQVAMENVRFMGTAKWRTMPSPKRWFPVSRDLNDDPEVWEFTDEFGDRSLRIVLEAFANVDRTDNRWRLSGRWLASLSRKVRQQPATVQRALGWMVAKHWLTVEEHAADGSPAVLSACNYWKYHKRRETEGTQTSLYLGVQHGSLPSLPNIPNLEEEKIGREEEGLLGGKKGIGTENNAGDKGRQSEPKNGRKGLNSSQPETESYPTEIAGRKSLQEEDLPAFLREPGKLREWSHVGDVAKEIAKRLH
jgi:hypothetical protein